MENKNEWIEIEIEGVDGRPERYIKRPDGSREPVAQAEAREGLKLLAAATRRKQKADQAWADAIVAAHATGWASLHEIGRAAGISHVAVRKRIRRPAPDA